MAKTVTIWKNKINIQRRKPFNWSALATRKWNRRFYRQKKQLYKSFKSDKGFYINTKVPKGDLPETVSKLIFTLPDNATMVNVKHQLDNIFGENISYSKIREAFIDIILRRNAHHNYKRKDDAGANGFYDDHADRLIRSLLIKRGINNYWRSDWKNKPLSIRKNVYKIFFDILKTTNIANRHYIQTYKPPTIRVVKPRKPTKFKGSTSKEDFIKKLKTKQFRSVQHADNWLSKYNR